MHLRVVRDDSDIDVVLPPRRQRDWWFLAGWFVYLLMFAVMAWHLIRWAS